MGTNRLAAREMSATTVHDVRRQGAGTALVAIRETGRRAPLFCVPAGYSDRLALGQLGRRLDQEQPFYLLQPPLGDPGLPPREQLRRMVGSHLAQIRSVRPHGPYVLLGSSSAGQIAVEVARQLSAAGESVRRLVLLETPFSITPVNHALHVLGVWTLGRLPHPVLRLPLLREVGLSSTDPGLRTTLSALRGYVPGPCDAPILFFAPTRGWSSTAIVVGGFNIALSRWRAVARAGFVLERVPGDHSGFLRGQHAPAFARLLDRYLAADQEQAG